MLEFILEFGKIYIETGLLITFTFICVNTFFRDEENDLTFGESLSFIFLYPFILYYIFNKKKNG